MLCINPDRPVQDGDGGEKRGEASARNGRTRCKRRAAGEQAHEQQEQPERGEEQRDVDANEKAEAEDESADRALEKRGARVGGRERDVEQAERVRDGEERDVVLEGRAGNGDKHERDEERDPRPARRFFHEQKSEHRGDRGKREAVAAEQHVADAEELEQTDDGIEPQDVVVEDDVLERHLAIEQSLRAERDRLAFVAEADAVAHVAAVIGQREREQRDDPRPARLGQSAPNLVW